MRHEAQQRATHRWAQACQAGRRANARARKHQHATNAGCDPGRVHTTHCYKNQVQRCFRAYCWLEYGMTADAVDAYYRNLYLASATRRRWGVPDLPLIGPGTDGDRYMSQVSPLSLLHENMMT